MSETLGNILLNDRDLNRRRIIQEFLLIWLDINLNSSKGHDAFSRSIADLSDAVSSIYTFMDIDECIDFLTDVKYEKVFMIDHDDVDGNIMSVLHQIPQLSASLMINQNMNRRRRRTGEKSKVYSPTLLTLVNRSNDSSGVTMKIIFHLVALQQKL